MKQLRGEPAGKKAPQAPQQHPGEPQMPAEVMFLMETLDSIAASLEVMASIQAARYVAETPVGVNSGADAVRGMCLDFLADESQNPPADTPG